MSIPRFVRTLVCVCLAAASVTAAFAQQPYPSRPIRILLGYGAGGMMDSMARLYAPKLSEVLNTPIVIENRPGASELLAAQPVMHAPPDGYLLWWGSGGALAQGPGIGLRPDLPQPLKNFTPISLIAEGEAVLLVRAGMPVSNMQEFVAYTKANPGKANYGSAGVGSGSHLTVEYLASLTGGSMVHIPYKSDAESTRDAMAGNVDLVMSMVGTALPLIAEGKLKPIAVTGPQRLKSLPNVQPLADSGVPELKGVGSYTFYGLMGPPGLPPAIVQRLNDAFSKVAAMPEVAQRMRELSIDPYVGTSASYSRFLDKEVTKWQQLRGKVKL